MAVYGMAAGDRSRAASQMGHVTREYSRVDSMSCVWALIMTLLIKNRSRIVRSKLCASKQKRSWMPSAKRDRWLLHCDLRQMRAEGTGPGCEQVTVRDEH